VVGDPVGRRVALPDDAGTLRILFSRLKENATEIEFSEPFVWKPGSMEVSVNFWADEAVESYWLHSIAACPCRD
jgi:hypothetical protein